MRHRIFYFTALAVLTVTVFAMFREPGGTRPTPAREQAADNRLTSGEKAQGWQLLYNGHDLQGWRPYQHQPGDAWISDKGSIHCLGTHNGHHRVDLLSDSVYENFVLELDWKIAPRANSGILYLVNETQAEPYQTGPEYQLIDDAGYPEKLEAWQQTGANYAMDPPLTLAAHPAGQWNHTSISVQHGKVEHWLNGKLVAQYELWTSTWEQHKATGKWKDTPSYGAIHSGHLDFQNHGDEAWFKNVKLKKLG
ncbi:protein of unknown function [Chitinophaga costaii]|uniref:3-keto-alpha-glucoside-1,2-lyase/3-keto-2-hydroxy-glucal hydratase domain-containing protein n=1 Tax=Chitinophaga costaii TaxID=1335309 RepID=A0A1C4F6I1_9BACT|nr:DUF1080 domain-containing protein [Chitinophaga costaii]PUZ21259.1 DUF1080 domain-containing protein [Chitinophaga costaii]SCC51315.1 protein of unknown function [Chitinophaga costaii]